MTIKFDHSTPRDPARIDRIIGLLREAWHLVPDWRLTQLVINAADVNETCSSMFHLEDDKLEGNLQKLIADARQK